jgi:hypothetical protein
MRRTVSLPTPRFSLVRWVFAGCRQSLLGNGPSRHYLRNPCIGARTEWRFLKALTETTSPVREANLYEFTGVAIVGIDTTNRAYK